MGNLWLIGICQRTLELGALCSSQIRTGSHWAQGKYVKKLHCINITHHDWFGQWWSKEASAGMRAEVPLKYTRTSCHSDGVYFWQYSQKHARVPGSRLLCSSSCSSSYKDGNTSFVANTCKIIPFGGFLVVAFFFPVHLLSFLFATETGVTHSEWLTLPNWIDRYQWCVPLCVIPWWSSAPLICLASVYRCNKNDSQIIVIKCFFCFDSPVEH